MVQGIDIGELLIVNPDDYARYERHPSEPFKTAISEGRGRLRDFAKLNGEVTLDEILDKVYGWETDFQDKVSPEEIEALNVLSLTLGTVKYYVEHASQNKEVEAKRQSIETQQEILKLVFSNLTNEGKPNETMTRSFGLVIYAFEKFFDPENSKMVDKGELRERGLWQGVMGMVTTGLLFNHEGWEVAIPPIELDLKHEVDLVVRSPEGKVYSVDITAKRGVFDTESGEKSQTFFVKKYKPRPEVAAAIDNINGTIRVNVPPLCDVDSEGFYADRCAGYPSPSAFAKFGESINK